MSSCVSGFLELTLPVIGSLHQIASTLIHLQCAQIQLREVAQGETNTADITFISILRTQVCTMDQTLR